MGGDHMSEVSKERIEELRRMNACKPALDWLAENGRTLDDLAQHPEWAYLSAKYYRGDLATMQQIVLLHGSAELRQKFADHVPGADVAALTKGLPPVG